MSLSCRGGTSQGVSAIGRGQMTTGEIGSKMERGLSPGRLRHPSL